MPESNNKQPSLDSQFKSLEDFKDDFKMMTQILGKGAFAEV